MKIGIAILLILLFLTAAVPVRDLVLDLETLWPNLDGNRWEYQQTYQLADWMAGGPDTVMSTVVLRLDGMTGTFDGSVVQNLVEEVPLPGAPEPGTPLHPSLSRTLWIVRPDLRPALAATSPVDLDEATAPLEDWVALFLHGGAFELTSEEIVTWRTELSAGKSWLFLSSDLTQLGDSFQLQLVPDLASDVFLTGTFAAIEDVSVPAGIMTSCLRVDYVIDYGTGICSGQGGLEGTFRAETTGSVHYKAGIGPVRSEETLRYHEGAENCGLVSDEAALHIVLELDSATVPTLPSTWGRIKSQYLRRTTAPDGIDPAPR